MQPTVQSRAAAKGAPETSVKSGSASSSGLLSRIPRLAPDGRISRSLDLIRGIAAVLVMLGHVCGLFFVNLHETAYTPPIRLFYFLTSLGHPSVVVFFVLSGFFISGSVIKALGTGRWTWKGYLVQRFTRLYVPLVPALLLGAFWDRLGMNLFAASGVYQGLPSDVNILAGNVIQRAGPMVALGNFLFLQEIFFRPFGSNYPLWSLSYEFWYYMAFPCLAVAVAARRQVAWALGLLLSAAAVGVLVGPKISAYFLIWLMGLGVMFIPRPLVARGLRLTLMAAAFLSLVAALYVGRAKIAYPLDLLVGVTFTALVYTILLPAAAEENGAGGKVHGFSQTLARFSYTLYLTHMPLLVFLHAWALQRGVPRWQPDVKHVALGTTLAVLAVLYAWGIALFTEFRTAEVRGWVSARLGMPRRSAGAA